MPPPKDRSKGEDIEPAMKTGRDEWGHIKDVRERRRIQNLLAQRKYRRRKAAAEALRAAVASEDAQDSSPGSSSLTMDGLEGRRSQEGSVISAAGTKEGPADLVASCSSAWSELEMAVENSLMAQLSNLPEPPTLASSRSQSHYPIACSSLNRSVTTSQHCPTDHTQLAPGTLIPLEVQYNCGSSILPSNFVHQAPPSETQTGAGQGEIDLSVSNFARQFPGNVNFEYQIDYPWFT